MIRITRQDGSVTIIRRGAGGAQYVRDRIDRHVEVEVEVLATTSKAVLVATADGTEEHWVPLSLVNVEDTDVELQKGERGTLSIAAWFAEKEGIE